MPGFDFRRAIPFIEAIPYGRWTSFTEVATAAGNPKAFMAAGNHMRDSDGRIDNYWRVIHNDGSVPENFRAPADMGPKDPYAARQSLMKEGVRFDANGAAAATPVLLVWGLGEGFPAASAGRRGCRHRARQTHRG